MASPKPTNPQAGQIWHDGQQYQRWNGQAWEVLDLDKYPRWCVWSTITPTDDDGSTSPPMELFPVMPYLDTLAQAQTQLATAIEQLQEDINYFSMEQFRQLGHSIKKCTNPDECECLKNEI